MPAIEPNSKRKLSRWLVRTWFGVLGLGAGLLVALIIYDYLWGEGIEHVGLDWFINLSVLCLAAVAVLLLPLLVVAVFLDRRRDA